MLKVAAVVFGWYLMVSGISTTQINENINRTEIPLFAKFKQSDYKFKFERLELVRYDKRYMNSIKVSTSKYNRTCPVVNITQWNFKIDVKNELETITQAYKFASNEYRVFPIRFQLNYCQAWKNNIAGVADSAKCGNFSGCPVFKGRNYAIYNWIPDPSMLPPFIPNGQYKAEMQFWYRSMELFVLAGYGIVDRPILYKFLVN